METYLGKAGILITAESIIAGFMIAYATLVSQVKVVVEIEEANIKPVQIFGKFFSSALSLYFIHERKNNAPIPMADSVLFVQILNTSKLKRDRTSKANQWENIERSIQGVIPIKGSKFDQYRLLFGDSRDFAANGTAKGLLIDCLQSFLMNAK
ncbi:MAG: hypothetical protein WB661_09395 [Candidatus Bathyarchaeia archaeon]